MRLENHFVDRPEGGQDDAGDEEEFHADRPRGFAPRRVGYSETMELIFEIRDAEEGGFFARALGHPIFTQGDTWDELRANLVEAVSLHFDDAATRPRLVQMHYVKDELIPLEAA